ncbi:GNAT family N-acetyltransferase [Vagococcus sp. DIV0080]|uniref:GNAT family N-acetyltransferase n=1 Tax=Candidatus Vagococcus giribetii TaxID=2230876 RepID=A0ABS3HPF2_9ENTE|nr:GNAT family N-acetyltransferase [Vagococcus sp. DIV0080]MBO0475619.1 GNAT family N-acetyltransferase [Vagococcus sp. DIV0080]
MTLQKIPVTTTSDINTLFPVVTDIWQEVFTPIIGDKQVAYMLKNYQSIENITKEIKEGASYFLLILDDVPVGYTAYEETDDFIYISKLYLTSTLRGKGLSSDVFAWYESLATGKKLHLNVNQGNALAISVYEHKGFTRVGERYVDIGEGYVMNDYIYEKVID